VRRIGSFFVNIPLGDGNGGEEDMLYVENGFGGEEEMTMTSSGAILRRVEKALRRAQVDNKENNDSFDTIASHIGKEGYGTKSKSTLDFDVYNNRSEFGA
jgi:hypothetical protein